MRYVRTRYVGLIVPIFFEKQLMACPFVFSGLKFGNVDPRLYPKKFNKPENAWNWVNANVTGWNEQ
ncbi:MAG: hypothetical protein OXU23_03535 [Candidatus Poribacteria bacterium]|nr:hypothetical protein [Candidatus Poribacteria bacterium]